MSAKFTCQFTVNGDDWYDDDGVIADYSELVAARLDVVARKIRGYHDGGTIMDGNGNRIGSWKLR
jgi:hypothetical protein